MGFDYINSEQKIRISLSRYAFSTMSEDMRVFGVNTPATFVNTLFENFRDTAKSTLSRYLLRQKNAFLSSLDSSNLDQMTKQNVVKHLISEEENQITNYLADLMSNKDISKLYHINNSNFEYLQYDCNEDDFYKQKPGLYLKCLIEEYTRLPFIERERIYRKDVFEIVENACQTHSMLQIRMDIYDKRETLLIYPYKIMADTLNTQSYLACYTRKPDELSKDKKDASFSMARLVKPVLLKQNAFLSKEDIKKIEDDIEKLSISYLLGNIAEIHVKLSKRGKLFYNNRIVSRPTKDEINSTADEYVFHCSENQAFYYFFTFGSEAEILSPASLRERMINSYQKAYENYQEKSPAAPADL